MRHYLQRTVWCELALHQPTLPIDPALRYLYLHGPLRKKGYASDRPCLDIHLPSGAVSNQVDPNNLKALARKWLACIQINETRLAAEALSALEMRGRQAEGGEPGITHFSKRPGELRYDY